MDSSAEKKWLQSQKYCIDIWWVCEHQLAQEVSFECLVQWTTGVALLVHVFLEQPEWILQTQQCRQYSVVDPVTIVGPKQDGNGFTTPSYKRNTIGVNSGVEHYGWSILSCHSLTRIPYAKDVTTSWLKVYLLFCGYFRNVEGYIQVVGNGYVRLLINYFS